MEIDRQGNWNTPYRKFRQVLYRCPNQLFIWQPYINIILGQKLNREQVNRNHFTFNGMPTNQGNLDGITDFKRTFTNQEQTTDQVGCRGLRSETQCDR